MQFCIYHTIERMCESRRIHNFACLFQKGRVNGVLRPSCCLVSVSRNLKRALYSRTPPMRWCAGFTLSLRPGKPCLLLSEENSMFETNAEHP